MPAPCGRFFAIILLDACPLSKEAPPLRRGYYYGFSILFNINIQRSDTSMFNRFIVIGFIAALLIIPLVALAGDVSIQLDPPTEYTDGSALLPGEIQEYRVYGANTPGGPYTQMGTIAGEQTSGTITVDRGLDWYFVATTVTTSGLESDYSNETTKLHSNPNPPTNLMAITITVQVQ